MEQTQQQQQQEPKQRRGRNVIFALDPSGSETNFTVNWLLENFIREGDQLDLVWALELDSELDANELGTSSMYLSEYQIQMEQQVESSAKEEIIKIAKKFEDAKINTKTHLLKSRTDSRNVIIEYVHHVAADLLVMGSSDLSMWKRMFLGSFSDYVQQHVHCPVLVVKGPKLSPKP